MSDRAHKGPPPGLNRSQITRMVFRGAFIVALVLAVFYVGASFYGTAGDPVSLTVKSERSEVPLTGAQARQLTLTLTLKNTSSKPVTLSANAPCKIVQWFIAHEKGDLIQGMASDCADAAVERVLKPGDSLSETITITLSANRYEADSLYQVAVRFWDRAGVLIIRIVNSAE